MIIRRCPLCGAVAEEGAPQTLKKGVKTYTIGCFDCDLHLFEDGRIGEHPQETTGRLAAKWNRRDGGG